MKGARPKIKLWLESRKGPLVGEGRIELLRAVEREGSLRRAARKLGMSYRYAWGIIKTLEKVLGARIVAATRGGKEKGGMRLTKVGRKILEEFERLKTSINEIVAEETFWEDISMKFSARNQIECVVKEVKVGEVGAVVKLEAKKPGTLTAYITREAAEALGLKPGSKVKAIIKATNVLLGKP